MFNFNYGKALLHRVLRKRNTFGKVKGYQQLFVSIRYGKWTMVFSGYHETTIKNDKDERIIKLDIHWRCV